MSLLDDVRTLAGPVATILAAGLVALVNYLPGRGGKAAQQQVDLTAGELENIRKALDIATAFRTDHALDSDVAPLKREFDVLIANRIDQDRLALQALDLYFDRLAWVHWIVPRAGPPQVARPALIAGRMNRNRRIASLFWLLAGVQTAAMSWVWIRVRHLPTMMVVILVEMLFFAVIGSIRFRLDARAARTELKAAAARAA